ncbi:MAG: zinc-binding alcohol dehydrogenase [Planctomycetes bacterium]|nr:zinc-binding alcohol dehydrogenase [Planctomycetota bacterium]
MKSKAIIIDHGKPSLGEFELRAPQDGEVIVRAESTGISPGTELRVMGESAADANVKPYIPGYSFVGIVEESHSADIAVGQRVYCAGTSHGGELDAAWGGHCELAVCEADSCIIVPDTVDAVTATLTALGGVAHHGMTRSKPLPGEKIVAVGLGVLGQIAARLHAQAGAEVFAMDLSQSRVDLSNAAGVKAEVPAESMLASVQKNMPDGPVMVIDSTGVPPVLKEALMLVPEIPWTNDPEPNNRYLVQGSYGGEFSIPYQDAFVRQLNFILPRNRQKQDHQGFIDLVASGKLIAKDLVVKTMKPDQAVEAYEALRDPETCPGTIAFDWT